MIRVFKTRHFNRWMRKTVLQDRALCHAVQEMLKGLIDADLGQSILKKRVALPGRGKSGSTRTLIATNKGSNWFYLFGFEKNDRSNISDDELGALQELAHELLRRSDEQLDIAVQHGALVEICHDNEN